LNSETVEQVLKSALQTGILTEQSPSVIFYDLPLYRETIHRLQSTFPTNTLHTIAVKANPIAGMLHIAKDAGMGAECASLPELVHAIHLGFPPERILFDSPAKTISELKFAIENNIYINLDNLQELDRLSELVKNSNYAVRAGLRINPQTGSGSWKGSSTAISTSKFGVPLLEEREKIVNAFQNNPWLVGLHVHTGSQVCPLPLVVQGVQSIMGLVKEIESNRAKKIELIDIGGGLPVSYENDDQNHNLTEYISLLKKNVPELFAYRLVTEFGRAISAKAGWAASRVEYTKHAGGRTIAVVHFGADLFVRTALLPEIWSHRITLHDSHGTLKTGPTEPVNIAGPLCFSGDLVAEGRELPIGVYPGDIVVVHDAGAYTLSMWSRYNSRQSPAVYGYDMNQEETKLCLLRPSESVDDVLRFWN